MSFKHIKLTVFSIEKTDLAQMALARAYIHALLHNSVVNTKGDRD